MASISESVSRLVNHFTRDIWSGDFKGSTKGQLRIVALSRWAYMVVTGFLNDQCLVRASALTFTTILAIVPFLAVAFSILKGLGVQNTEYIRDLLMRVTTGDEDLINHILSYIDNTNLKALGWVGVVTLLATIMSVVSNIERSFNTIWNVPHGRTWWRKFTDFFSIIVICPLLMVMATGLTVTLEQQGVVRKMTDVMGMPDIQVALFKALPMAVICLVFTFIFAFVPNTKVRFKGAIIGGVVAGTAWQWAQWAYINYQVGAAKYNAIYGSFAQLPLFLIWLYISWVILLFGAEMAYAVQHYRTFLGERQSDGASHMERIRVAALALAKLTQCFEAGRQAPSLERMSIGLDIPTRLLHAVFQTLSQAGVVARVDDPEHEIYVLARTPSTLRLTDVIRVLAKAKKGGGRNGDMLADRLALMKLLTDLAQASTSSAANLNMVEFAVQLEKEGELGTESADE